jgi:hypothetical protein
MPCSGLLGQVGRVFLSSETSDSWLELRRSGMRPVSNKLSAGVARH